MFETIDLNTRLKYLFMNMEMIRMKSKNLVINRLALNIATRFAIKNPKRNIPRLIKSVERFSSDPNQKKIILCISFF
jgi:hypothetical protein